MLVGSLHTQDNCLTPRASPCLLRIYGDVTGPGRRIKFLRPTAFGILFGARALSRHHIFFVYSENHSQCDNYLLVCNSHADKCRVNVLFFNRKIYFPGLCGTLL